MTRVPRPSLPGGAIGLSVLVWLALWASINSGPWNLIAEPRDTLGWFNALRASLPLLVPVTWLAVVSLRRGGPRVPTTPEAMWIGYGLIMLLSTLQIDHWFNYAYWAFAYLSVFAAIDITLGRDPDIQRAADMNRLNWLIATAFFIAMLVVARDVLFVAGTTGLTGYGIEGRMGPVAGAAFTRSSGLARLAIVPALIALVWMIESKGPRRLLWSGVFVVSTSLIWLFQSRQGIIGLAAAGAFVMLLIGQRTRVIGGVILVLAGISVWVGAIQDSAVDYVIQHATRAEGLSAFESMTGRDVIWRLGLKAAEASPLIGFGAQADRRILGMNASNGLLYALLSGGYPGMLLYMGGILWGWVLFARAVARDYARTAAERVFLVQAGGIMAYLTLRHIPENTSALFSVDLLIFAPLLAYLGTLDRIRSEERRRGLATKQGPPVEGLGVAAHLEHPDAVGRAMERPVKRWMGREG